MSEFCTCPKCNSDMIEFDSPQFEDGCIYVQVQCTEFDCGFGWTEIYKFAWNETYNTGEEIDDEGNVIKKDKQNAI
jgi:hypothetical protein